jgi:hypothetical protein
MLPMPHPLLLQLTRRYPFTTQKLIIFEDTVMISISYHIV